MDEATSEPLYEDLRNRERSLVQQWSYYLTMHDVQKRKSRLGILSTAFSSINANQERLPTPTITPNTDNPPSPKEANVQLIIKHTVSP